MLKSPLAVLASLGVLLACVATPAAAQSNRNWATSFAATPLGHRLGNPAAPIKVVTFISYTCPHCAHFEVASDAPLRAGYLRTGRVSVEVRSLIRNTMDVVATLVAECGPESRFWANHRAIIRAQDQWTARERALSAAQRARWNSGTVGSRMRAAAADLQFYQLMEPRGYTRAQLDQCLNDEARANAIAENSRAQSAHYGIPGTPAFLINDRLDGEIYDWPSLQARLDAALAAR